MQLFVTVEGADFAPLTGIPSLLFFLASNAALPPAVYWLAKRWGRTPLGCGTKNERAT
ncbi:hypothetical protein [Paenibacillus ehimensis]|uniref:hypothetical protein n=1 Tax=Paenibacillus ehimensis TaxID=79264 RepID=UPI0013E350CF|nr:hypothetical protein [Paenibacillus ehimensis]MEC0210041.1 hypothetical protein [Paenibacillus ehimensis]